MSPVLQEVYLLKHNPQTLAVEDSWHGDGHFEGGTVNSAPAWPGTWLISVAARVQEDINGTCFWLKGMHRRIATAEMQDDLQHS